MIVLLHGLTATRRYVVMGSTALQRGGMRVLAYDARGHGHSSPAPDREYGYEHLASDLAAVVGAVGRRARDPGGGVDGGPYGGSVRARVSGAGRGVRD